MSGRKSVIPGNKLQKELLWQRNKFLAPGSGETHSAYGYIEKVYDPDYIKSNSPDDPETRNKILDNPEYIFAKVVLDNGLSVTLPIDEPEDIIYSVYGNYPQLEGRRIKVIFHNGSIRNGVIKIHRGARKKLVSHEEVSNVFDIGKIL